MKLIAALLLSVSAAASGQNVILTPNIEAGRQVDNLGNGTVVRVTTPDRRFTSMAIDDHGVVVFNGAMATVDWSAESVVTQAGPLAAYVYVRVGGRWFLMPVYNLPEVQE